MSFSWPGQNIIIECIKVLYCVVTLHIIVPSHPKRNTHFWKEMAFSPQMKTFSNYCFDILVSFCPYYPYI